MIGSTNLQVFDSVIDTLATVDISKNVANDVLS